MSPDRIDFPAYERAPTPTIDDFFKELNEVVDPELEEEQPPKNIMDEFLAKFNPSPPPDPTVPNPDDSPIFEAIVSELKDTDITTDPEERDDSAAFNQALAAAIKEVKYTL